MTGLTCRTAAFRGQVERPFWVGRQGNCRPPSGLHIYPFWQRQRVVKVDTEVSYCAVHFGVAQQKLNRPQIARLLVDMRHLRPTQGMRGCQSARKTAPPL